ncbi:hypothetical protein HZH66_003622 [Vespula vulgaris]|uniref:Uncharacterized protein n=1 Tax=Vespula vulgaris TaxID=7454 RepID=A0A834KIL5_VESVU|nr:hypothetical protein HZH66_003622 [Vespula vulgaris]
MVGTTADAAAAATAVTTTAAGTAAATAAAGGSDSDGGGGALRKGDAMRDNGCFCLSDAPRISMCSTFRAYPHSVSTISTISEPRRRPHKLEFIYAAPVGRFLQQGRQGRDNAELIALRERKAAMLALNVSAHRLITDLGTSTSLIFTALKDGVADLYRVWDETFQRDNEASRANIGKREKARSLVTFSTGDFETRVTGLLALTQGSRV